MIIHDSVPTVVGPRAAGLLRWDGFHANDPHDQPVWLVPHGTRTHQKGVIRSRQWRLPWKIVDGVAIANPALVFSHLAIGLRPLQRWDNDPDPISCVDRIELALEYCLRHGYRLATGARGRGAPTATTLSQLLIRRGIGEPPTDSYAEVRLIQRLRRHGLDRVFRQVPLLRGGRIVNRIDIVVPYHPRSLRPFAFDAEVGVPIEVDGRAYHERQFEKDRVRHNNHTMAGGRLLVATPSLIEGSFTRFGADIVRVLARFAPKTATQIPTTAFG